MEINRQHLTEFVNKSLRHCYLGEMKKAEDSEREGFFEMEYSEGDWNYRDSFVGFYQSTGQEIVRLQNKPVWCRNYGGGMENDYINDSVVFGKVENFLRSTLAKNLDDKIFRPRGPESHIDADLKYACSWSGDITDYEATEEIFYHDKKIFIHRVFGGLIVGRD